MPDFLHQTSQKQLNLFDFISYQIKGIEVKKIISQNLGCEGRVDFRTNKVA